MSATPSCTSSNAIPLTNTHENRDEKKERKINKCPFRVHDIVATRPLADSRYWRFGKISFKVKEYSIKVFVPLGFSVDENELEVIFPDVSIGIKNVIKNNNLIGCNYILGTENEDSFINLMSRYRTFIKEEE